MRRHQSTNLPLSGAAVASAVATAGGATRTGTTNDAVLLFGAASVSVLGTGISPANSATDGTTITLTQPGIYSVAYGFDAGAGATVLYGVSLNVAAAGLTDNPSFATSGFLAINSIIAPAATTIPGGHSLLVPVTSTLAYAVGGAVLRFHGTDGADGAPNSIVLASMWYRVARVMDLHI